MTCRLLSCWQGNVLLHINVGFLSKALRTSAGDCGVARGFFWPSFHQYMTRSYKRTDGHQSLAKEPGPDVKKQRCALWHLTWLVLHLPQFPWQDEAATREAGVQPAVDTGAEEEAEGVPPFNTGLSRPADQKTPGFCANIQCRVWFPKSQIR